MYNKHICIHIYIPIYIYIYIHILLGKVFIGGSYNYFRQPGRTPKVSQSLKHSKCKTVLRRQGSTPGPHNKNPRHKTFAKGWVAKTNIFDRYLDGCAKIFQYFQRVGSEHTGIFQCGLSVS